MGTAPLADGGSTMNRTLPAHPRRRQGPVLPHNTKPGPRSRAMRARSTFICSRQAPQTACTGQPSRRMCATVSARARHCAGPQVPGRGLPPMTHATNWAECLTGGYGIPAPTRAGVRVPTSLESGQTPKRSALSFALLSAGACLRRQVASDRRCVALPFVSVLDDLPRPKQLIGSGQRMRRANCSVFVLTPVDAPSTRVLRVHRVRLRSGRGDA